MKITEVTDSRIKRMIRNKSVFLINEMMNTYGYSRDEALKRFIQTVTYEILLNPETDFYLESNESVWDTLRAELNGNLEELLVV